MDGIFAILPVVVKAADQAVTPFAIRQSCREFCFFIDHSGVHPQRDMNRSTVWIG